MLKPHKQTRISGTAVLLVAVVLSPSIAQNTGSPTDGERLAQYEALLFSEPGVSLPQERAMEPPVPNQLPEPAEMVKGGRVQRLPADRQSWKRVSLRQVSTPLTAVAPQIAPQPNHDFGPFLPPVAPGAPESTRVTRVHDGPDSVQSKSTASLDLVKDGESLYDNSPSNDIATPEGTPVFQLARTPFTQDPLPTVEPHAANALSERILSSEYQPQQLFSHDAGPTGSMGTWPCTTCGLNFCCCSDVRWRVRAEALFLHRSRADGFDDPLINCNCVVPTIYRPDSLSMDFHGGPRLTVIRDDLCGGCDLEGSYYLIDHWTGSAGLVGPVIALGQDLGVGSVDVRHESRLQNAELNLFKDCTNWSQFMLGFRWLELGEHASIIGGGTLIPTFDQRVHALNTLLGGQIGLRKSIWDSGGQVTANATVKGGIFYNQIQRTTSGFGSTPLEKDRTSFIGELDFAINYEVTDCWALNLGYQVMWLTSVAEATDQFFSPGAIHDDGNVVLHGIRIGLTKTW